MTAILRTRVGRDTKGLPPIFRGNSPSRQSPGMSADFGFRVVLYLQPRTTR